MMPGVKCDLRFHYHGIYLSRYRLVYRHQRAKKCATEMSVCQCPSLLPVLCKPTQYVLSYFGKKVTDARKRYLAYVKEGIAQGRRPDLVGGGLVRSLGGWSAVKKLRLKGQDRVKGDERILGDGEFVTALLSEANERLDRRYELKGMGYDLEKIGRRVSKIYGIEKNEIYSKGRRKVQVNARDLLCYWAVREIGMTCTEIAKRLGMSQPGVGYAVSRGEKIVKKHKYQLHK